MYESVDAGDRWHVVPLAYAIITVASVAILNQCIQVRGSR